MNYTGTYIPVPRLRLCQTEKGATIFGLELNSINTLGRVLSIYDGPAVDSSLVAEFIGSGRPGTAYQLSRTATVTLKSPLAYSYMYPYYTFLVTIR